MHIYIYLGSGGGGGVLLYRHLCARSIFDTLFLDRKKFYFTQESTIYSGESQQYILFVLKKKCLLVRFSFAAPPKICEKSLKPRDKLTGAPVETRA